MKRRRPLATSATSSPTPESFDQLTVAGVLLIGAEALSARSGADAPREAALLLAGVLDTNPGQLRLNPARRLDEGQLAEYRRRLERRLAGEPLQYIEGRAAFRDLSLRVTPSVLIPRPETEQLVERVLQWCRGRRGLRGMDLGTGSGAIAISLAVEGPFDSMLAVDISSQALDLARENAEAAGVLDRVELRLGPFFEAVGEDERFDAIVSNPPYVAAGEMDSLPAEVRDWEPPEALYAGSTGLEVIERLVADAPEYLQPSGLLAMEIAPDLADDVVELVRTGEAFEAPQVEPDLAGQRRIVIAERACTR